MRISVELDGTQEGILSVLQMVDEILKHEREFSSILFFQRELTPTHEGRVRIDLTAEEMQRSPRSIAQQVVAQTERDAEWEILEQAIPQIIKRSREELGITLLPHQAEILAREWCGSSPSSILISSESPPGL